MVPGVHPLITNALLDGAGLLSLRSHPELERSILRAARRGELTRLSPGIYCDSAHAHQLEVRARAIMLAEPTAVITQHAAAALSWWPDLKVFEIEAVHPHRNKSFLPGITWRRRHIPEELVLEHHGIRITCPAMTVLDLIPDMGGTAIDEALRRKATCLTDLQNALTLTPKRPGNKHRTQLLVDSRDEPWSEAERQFHRVLRSLDLPCSYRTNYWVSLPGGIRHPIDVALVELMLGFEIDGYAFHRQRAAFDRDRAVEMAVAQLGWQIVRIAASDVFDNPELPQQLQSITNARLALLRG